MEFLQNNILHLEHKLIKQVGITFKKKNRNDSDFLLYLCLCYFNEYFVNNIIFYIDILYINVYGIPTFIYILVNIIINISIYI